jgi:hypothetical protein
LKANLLVGINADDKHVTHLSGAREISNMADVQDVETAVRENYSGTGGASRSDAVHKFFAR